MTRSHHRSCSSAALLGALSLALPASGCRATFPSYAMRMVWPHKDVVVVSVMLEERLSPEEYRSIVDREFDSVASKLDPRDVFVYEVRFEFLVRTDDTHLGHQRVAEVFLRGFDSSSSGARPFAVPQVVLY